MPTVIEHESLVADMGPPHDDGPNARSDDETGVGLGTLLRGRLAHLSIDSVEEVREVRRRE